MKYFEDLIRKRLKVETDNLIIAQGKKKPLFIMLSQNFLKVNKEFRTLWSDSSEVNNLIFLERCLYLFDLEGPHVAYNQLAKKDIIRVINLCEEISKETIKNEPILFGSIFPFWCLLSVKVTNTKEVQGRRNIKAFLNYNPVILQHFIQFGIQNVQVIDKVPNEITEATPKQLQESSFKIDDENILNIIAPQFYTQQLFFREIIKMEAIHKRRILTLENGRKKRLDDIQRLVAINDFFKKNPHIEKEFVNYSLGKRGPFKFTIPSNLNKKLVLHALYINVNRKIKSLKKSGVDIDFSSTIS